MDTQLIDVAEFDRYVEIDGVGFTMTTAGAEQFKSVLAAAGDSAWIALGGTEIRITLATSITIRPCAADSMLINTFDLRGKENSIEIL